MLEDAYVGDALLFARDPKTKTQIWMAPPPYMTPFLKASGKEMTFPPRFGEHNEEIYGGLLYYSGEKIAGLKEKGII